MAVQPDQVEDRVRQHPLHRVGGVVPGQREPELLVADTGGDRAVAVDVDVGGHADEHPLALARQAGEVGDLDAGVQHDAPDPNPGRLAQLVGRFRIAVHDDAGRVHPARLGDGQLTG